MVQTTRQLSYNSQLKVTTAKYYIPSGRCIQALDYAHRNEDGTVNKFADSLRAAFKTKGGRQVYDGNGIDPDIVVEDQYVGAAAVALIQDGLIFEYASKYCGEHPAMPDLTTFKLTDADYNKFTEWVKTKKFKYTTTVEETANELISAAKEERYYGELETQLTDLKRKIESNKLSDLARSKKVISELLEQQIAFHYALAEGQAAVSLQNDLTVSEARKVLTDNVKYKSILSPH